MWVRSNRSQIVGFVPNCQGGPREYSTGSVLEGESAIMVAGETWGSTVSSIGSPVTSSDLEALGRSYITPELAESAGLRRVNDIEASTLFDRYNDTGDNAGIIFPYRWPGESKETYRLRRDHPPDSGIDGPCKNQRTPFPP